MANLKRWSWAHLEKELAFAEAAELPDDFAKAWLEALRYEKARREEEQENE